MFFLFPLPLSATLWGWFFGGGYFLQGGGELFHLERSRESGSRQGGVLWGLVAEGGRRAPCGLYYALLGRSAWGPLDGRTAGESATSSWFHEQEFAVRVGASHTLSSVTFLLYGGYGKHEESNRFAENMPLSVLFRNRYSFSLVGAEMGYAAGCCSAALQIELRYPMDGVESREIPGMGFSKIVMEDRIHWELLFPLSYRCFTLTPFYRYRKYGSHEDPDPTQDFVGMTTREAGIRAEWLQSF